MAIRYIGSKARIADSILEIVGPPDGGRFVDGFSGTGIVALSAAKLGWAVHANDFLKSSAIITRASLTSELEVPMYGIGGYSRALNELNIIDGSKGFITRHYSPASVETIDHERSYFTVLNAMKIDGIRARISEWLVEERISELESSILISDLIHAANRVANTAGTYGYFLKNWSNGSLTDLTLTATTFRGKFQAPRTVTSEDIFDLEVAPEDTLYLDPPYTKRQYAAYYHIPETIAVYDEPEISGKSGLRNWRSLSSDFCYKQRALGAFERVIKTIAPKRTLISYSSDAHISRSSLVELLETFGTVDLHQLGPIARYRPNHKARSGEVSEFLFELTVS